jgi:hypothetical protein
MRTTLTIDDDVAVELDRLRKKRDATLRDVVNDVLRRGLKDASARPRKKEPFRTKVVDLGKPLLPNVDNVHNVLAYVEGEDYR